MFADTRIQFDGGVKLPGALFAYLKCLRDYKPPGMISIHGFVTTNDISYFEQAFNTQIAPHLEEGLSKRLAASSSARWVDRSIALFFVKREHQGWRCNLSYSSNIGEKLEKTESDTENIYDKAEKIITITDLTYKDKGSETSVSVDFGQPWGCKPEEGAAPVLHSILSERICARENPAKIQLRLPQAEALFTRLSNDLGATHFYVAPVAEYFHDPYMFLFRSFDYPSKPVSESELERIKNFVNREKLLQLLEKYSIKVIRGTSGGACIISVDYAHKPFKEAPHYDSCIPLYPYYFVNRDLNRDGAKIDASRFIDIIVNDLDEHAACADECADEFASCKIVRRQLLDEIIALNKKWKYEASRSVLLHPQTDFREEMKERFIQLLNKQERIDFGLE